MAEAQASGRVGSVPHVADEEPDEDGFVGEGSEDQGQATESIAGYTFEQARPSQDATIGVSQSLPKQRRCSICGELGHTARTCTAEGTVGVATRASRKPSKEAVGSIAPMIIGTLNFSVVSTFGADCGLTDLEGKILIPSVQRMMERMPAAAATKAALVLDPLIIVTVFVMWGRRILSVKAAEQRKKYAQEPFEQMRANGIAGTTFGPNVPVGSTPNYAANGVVSVSSADGNQQTNGLVDTGITDPTTYGIPENVRRAFDDNL